MQPPSTAAAGSQPHAPASGPERLVKVRARASGVATAGLVRLPVSGRRVVLVRVSEESRRGALSAEDSETIEAGARLALDMRLPVVVVLASSGADVLDGVAALDGWGRAARALSACSGVVPVAIIAYGLAVSGPALLLGMADLVVMTSEAVAYVSGPTAVAQMTGLRLLPEQLGGQRVHARTTGVAALLANDTGHALEVVD
ncbi:MAG TPA: carboxyl transferase domain-containing protein, partial [Acidimicrobiales bacterium]|nr:carboxyl transferase domain-containing protein [Acidimicrobiales bacterium]